MSIIGGILDTPADDPALSWIEKLISSNDYLLIKKMPDGSFSGIRRQIYGWWLSNRLDCSGCADSYVFEGMV